MDSKKLLLIFPISFTLTYFAAGIFYDAKYVVYFKPFIIPSFMLYVILSNYKKLTIKFYLFSLFFYLGEMCILFGFKFIPVLRIGLLCYLFCYITLFLSMKNNLEEKIIRNIFSGFTFLVLILNCFFLIAILYILTTAINDFYTNFIIILNAISAVAVGVVAVLNLSIDDKPSRFLYFFGVFALIFNDILAALESYYLESTVLNTIDRLLHFIAFYLIYLFARNSELVTNKGKIVLI